MAEQGELVAEALRGVLSGREVMRTGTSTARFLNAAVGHPGGNVGWWHGSGWWWWLVLVAVSLGFVVALVWLVQRGERPRASRARQILAERYARGEIGTEEYEQQRRVLED